MIPLVVTATARGPHPRYKIMFSNMISSFLHKVPNTLSQTGAKKLAAAEHRLLHDAQKFFLPWQFHRKIVSQKFIETLPETNMAPYRESLFFLVNTIKMVDCAACYVSLPECKCLFWFKEAPRKVEVSRGDASYC